MRTRIILVFFVCLSLFFCASAERNIQKARMNDPEYHYKIGFINFTSGNYEQAKIAFDKAVSLDSHHYLALDYLGLIHFAEGNYKESVKFFQKCLEVNPKFTDAHNNLGMVYQEMGYFKKSEIEYKKAISDKYYPTKEKPYFNLAKLYVKIGRLEEALDFVKNAISENTNYAPAYNLEGNILEKIGNYPEAIKSYGLAVKIVPEETGFNFNLAVALFKHGDYKRAKDVFEKIYSKVKDPEMKEKIKKYLEIINK